jgi:hypothetical protein
MRYLLILLLTVSLTSCFVFDKAPNVRINIEKTALSEIDSLFLTGDSRDNINQLWIGKKVTMDQSTYFLYLVHQNSRIKLRLTNSKVIFSDSTIILNPSSVIKISKNNGEIGFSKIVKSESLRYISMFLAIFMIVFIIKVPIATLINRPNSKWRFMLIYTGLNLIYLFVVILLINFLDDIFAILLYPFYLIVFGSDIIFFLKQNPDRSLTRSIIAGIVSNILFLTIGQFIITFAIMNFS